MKTKNFFTGLLLLVSFFYYGQTSTFEFDYTNINLDKEVVYNPNSLNVYKFGWGYNLFQKRGRFFLNLGYMNMKHKDNVEQIGSSHFENYLYGVKIIYKPFAKSWTTRVQPVIQVNYTSAFSIRDKNEKSTNFLQIYKNKAENFGGGKYIQNVYDPRLHYFSGSLGAEGFITENIALNLMLNYDMVSVDGEKSNGISFSTGLRVFIY